LASPHGCASFTYFVCAGEARLAALRLGNLCGNGPDLWLNLQKRYDPQRAEQALGAKIKAIPTLKVA
jgi:plasmid maintenance system antidote protein VapI